VDTITAAPDKGEITETADLTGVTLSWPAYKAAGRDWVGALPLPLYVLSFLALGLPLAFMASDTERGVMFVPAGVFVPVWLIGWAVGAVFVALAVRKALRPPTPEFVRLEADALHYEPGRGPDRFRSCAELPNGTVAAIKPAPATTAPRDSIRRFGVDRVGDRQRLYMDLDDQRVEIGGCLTESERAWLFAALQQWLGEQPSPQPWARAASRDRREPQP
jgi:hypothetical protein